MVFSPQLAMYARCAIGFLLNPFFIGMSCFSVLLYLFWREKKGAYGAIALCLLIGSWMLSTGWLPHWMMTTLEHQYSPIQQINPAIHWVVVLGGGVLEDSERPENEVLSNTSIKRLLEGVRLYRQLPDARLMLSGGGAPKDAQSVGARLDALATWFDIPADRRVLETVSFNTADEAREVKRWVHQHAFYLVTSANHMPRAMALFHKQGLHPIAAPCDYTYFWDKHWVSIYLPNISNVSYASVAWHEWLGLLWGKWRGLL